MAWLAGLATGLLAAALAAAGPAVAVDPAAISLQILKPSATIPSADSVISGALDARFTAITAPKLRLRGGTLWLKLQTAGAVDPLLVPVVVAREGHEPRVQLFGLGPNGYVELPRAAQLPEFGGGHEVVFMLPRGQGALPLYALVSAPDAGLHPLHFRASTLNEALHRGAVHARMIALAVGALSALALGALLIWFVLKDPVFILYTALITTQALYVVFLSGQGFDWPLLSYAVPLASYAWNVPAALSGAAACLFVREIADLRRSSPRAADAFGWLAVAFGVLTLANLAKPFGFESQVNAAGNILFIGSCVFTLIVSFLAWRRGNRAAGWFLLAWGVFEAFTIASSVQLLLSDGEDGEQLLYAGYPLSMVAAAVLIALGIADRLHHQRIALTEAERRAQTDPLTGVMNRRSLIERLDAACVRARTRGLPISLLFIDLDHFKEINDTFGHQAGDACLAAIIAPIHSELRQSDAIGRYGGEEFVVILSSADAAAAHPIAERIRKRVADIRVDGYGEPISLTCSIGIATSDTLGVWGQHLIARADAAVYVAKRAGRNRVQFAEPVAA
jgi:diguanylate cyclase (GGDEF)-like protein